ncbi:MAG: phage shock envelope stress response protein PspM [Micromonosporaceae bacterium]
MASDPRTRHLRRLNRLHRSARRWTALAASLAGAAAVLVPYAGLGAPDAVWAAAAGGSAVLAGFRWRDHRRAADLPMPDPLPPDQHGFSGVERLLRGHPLGRTLSDELRRQRDRIGFRDSAAAESWQRLERACRAMLALAERLPASAGESAAEGLAVHAVLRDLAYRIRDVERGIAAAPPDARQPLLGARDALVAQLTEGVDGYERLVAAAAECVAEGARSVDNPAAVRLAEATDRLVGFAGGLGELRRLSTPVTPAAAAPPSGRP